MNNRAFVLLIARYCYFSVALAGTIFLLSAIINLARPNSFTLRRPGDTIVSVNTKLAKKIADTRHTVIIDARDIEPYGAMHIVRAICIPASDYRFMREDTRADIENADALMIYCLDEKCSKAKSLAKEIAKQYPETVIYIIANGLKGWIEKGYPTMTGEE